MISDTSAQYLDSLVDFLDFATPVFIPSLLVFGYHSSLSLRTWFAVQNAPIRNPPAHLPQPLYLSDDEHQSPLARLENNLLNFCHRYSLLATFPPLWLAFTLVVGMVMQAMQLNPFGVDADAFFRYALLPVFVVANCRLLTSVTGVEKRIVFRSRGGQPFIQSYIRTDIEKALSFTPYLAAALVSYRASFCGTDRLSLSITYGALMHLLVSSEITVSRSFKASVLCAGVNAMTVLFFLTILTSSSTRTQALPPFLGAFIERAQLVFSNRHYAGFSLFSADSDGAENSKWPLFILSVLWSVFPADLISMCYRFDYHRHVADTVLSSESGELRLAGQEQDGLPDNANVGFLNVKRINADSIRTLASATSTFSHQPSNTFYDLEDSFDFDFGARIPSSDSIPQVPMPYFCSAITTWVLCNVILYALLQYNGMTSSIEFHYVESLSALVTMPATVLVTLMVAIIRQDIPALWHYTERWTQRRESKNYEASITGEKA